MAARMGMDRAAIRKLESGVHTNPTIGTLNRYLHALGKRLVVSLVDDYQTPVAVASPAIARR
jgi:transcriptional regulator with XRE-family HTH domain